MFSSPPSASIATTSGSGGRGTGNGGRLSIEACGNCVELDVGVDVGADALVEERELGKKLR